MKVLPILSYGCCCFFFLLFITAFTGFISEEVTDVIMFWLLIMMITLLVSITQLIYTIRTAKVKNYIPEAHPVLDDIHFLSEPRRLTTTSFTLKGIAITNNILMLVHVFLSAHGLKSWIILCGEIFNTDMEVHEWALFFMIPAAVLAVPTLIYNVRTFNLKWLA